MQGCKVTVKRTIRYLGVQLYTRFLYIEYACTIASGDKRTAVVVLVLARMAPSLPTGNCKEEDIRGENTIII